MNISRGLWRAWIFVTVLWIIGASALAFVVLPDNVARKYQYIYNMREDVGDPNSVDWTKDFYALMQSPSRNMLPAAFDILAYQNVASSDGDVKKGAMIAVDFPDRSRLYLSAQMTKDRITFRRHFGTSAGNGTARKRCRLLAAHLFRPWFY